MYRRRSKLNSSVNKAVLGSVIKAHTMYDELVNDTLPNIGEELYWLDTELQDWEAGELDSSYDDYIKECADIVREFNGRLHKLHTELHIRVQELDVED